MSLHRRLRVHHPAGTKDLVIRSDTRPTTYTGFIEFLQARVLALAKIAPQDIFLTFLDADGVTVDLEDDADLLVMWQTGDRGIPGYSITVAARVSSYVGI
ncbi:hypothetical protein HDU93_003051 [Gonapodya sp. JEL0774]|nr:hypothetical protein HDU93_003051 [Gonapodya sp. JEL0774]